MDCPARYRGLLSGHRRRSYRICPDAASGDADDLRFAGYGIVVLLSHVRACNESSRDFCAADGRSGPHRPHSCDSPIRGEPWQHAIELSDASSRGSLRTRSGWGARICELKGTRLKSVDLSRVLYFPLLRVIRRKLEFRRGRVLLADEAFDLGHHLRMLVGDVLGFAGSLPNRTARPKSARRLARIRFCRTPFQLPTRTTASRRDWETRDNRNGRGG